MASKPPKQEKNPLDRMPVRKLAAGLRKQLRRKLDEKNPDWKSGKANKE
jgi:hypothetical protein